MSRAGTSFFFQDSNKNEGEITLLMMSFLGDKGKCQKDITYPEKLL